MLRNICFDINTKSMYQMANYCKNIGIFIIFFMKLGSNKKRTLAKQRKLIFFDRVYNIFCNAIT